MTEPARFRRGPRIAATLLLLAVVAALAVPWLRAPAPHIVLIVWDTCRADRTAVGGYARATTPRLDALAREGTTFRRAFSPSPWTPPAHASLFTGLLPRNHGLREGTGDKVGPGIPLLAETLRDGGYETACLAANPQISAATGLDAGFGTVVPCWGGGEWKGDGREVVERLRAWLPRRRPGGGKPLFLFVNLMETHLPYTFETAALAAVHGDGAVNGARRAAAAVTDERASNHLHGLDPVDDATVADLRLAYDGAVRTLDGITGEILDLLREEGILAHALVAVCGDHGENLGEHGDLNHLASVGDPVLHVPLVLRWPGRFEGGRVVDEQVRLQDLYPTLLEAARIAIPPGAGRDAVSLAEEPLRSRVAVAEYGPAGGLVAKVARVFPTLPPSTFVRYHHSLLAVRDPPDVPGARKYVSATRTGEDGEAVLVREELFDVVADPGELRNLLGPGAPPAERAAADRLRAAGGR